MIQYFREKKVFLLTLQIEWEENDKSMAFNHSFSNY